MKLNKIPIKATPGLTILLFIGLNIFCQSNGFSQEKLEGRNYPLPKVISFNPDSIHYQPIFNGEKDSVVFYSGIVTLLPNTSGELHCTDEYEEIIIALEGQGQLKITNQKSLSINFGKIAFVPQNTEHQMFNSGKENFKYIYVATKSKKL